MKYAQYKILIWFTIGAILLFAGTAYAIPQVREYNRQREIQFYIDYQEEVHQLADESRDRENDWHIIAQKAITKAEVEKVTQNRLGAMWHAAQVEIERLRDEDFQ